MARAAVFTLAFAALASGARYADYSGVKMPEYGGGAADYEGPRDLSPAPSDEYRDHSPDTPASLYYKDEEDPIGKIDPEIWRNPETNHKKDSMDDANLDTLDKYSPYEMIPKFRPSNRFSKRVSRLKSSSSERESEIPLKQHIKYIRNRNLHRGEHEHDNFLHDNGENRNYNDNNFHKKNIRYPQKRTTVRTKKPRRKPRDRFVKSQSEDENLYNDDDLFKGGLNKGREDHDYHAVDERRRLSPEHLDKGISRRYIPTVEDIDDHTSKIDEIQQKNFDEYHNYYDMERVNSIKNKLPSLLPRPTNPWTLVPTPTSQETTRRRDVSAYRRANKAPIPPIDNTPQVEITASTTALTSTTLSSTASTPSTLTVSIAKVDLSLAEMSRLSILKKALKKEINVLNTNSTKKPPVLLQLATKMQTVVMVEPASSQRPSRRMIEISEDTPHRLEQVKRLMRSKLVADAKDIQELTDNWDDMVCEYIDMSLLENSATKNATSVTFTMLIIVSLSGYIVLK